MHPSLYTFPIFPLGSKLRNTIVGSSRLILSFSSLAIALCLFSIADEYAPPGCATQATTRDLSAADPSGAREHVSGTCRKELLDHLGPILLYLFGSQRFRQLGRKNPQIVVS